MSGGVLFLQSFGYFGGGAIGNILNQWANAGVFSYAIPFLLIFALTYGILSKMNVFGGNSKAINSIISLAVGLMALQFPTVPQFFSEIFPALGVGLAVLLVLMIATGLWGGSSNNSGKWLKGLAIVTGIVVFLVWFNNSATFGTGFGFWQWIQYYIGGGLWTIIGVGLLIGGVIWVISKTGNDGGSKP